MNIYILNFLKLYLNKCLRCVCMCIGGGCRFFFVLFHIFVLVSVLYTKYINYLCIYMLYAVYI